MTKENLEMEMKKQDYLKRKYDKVGHFISYHQAIDLVRDINPKNALEIGVGNGLVSDYLKKLGIDITTCDINLDLEPDVVGDVRALPFKDKSFDAVLAFQVLEHLPFSDFEKSLKEIERISKRFVIISLPHRILGIEVVIKGYFVNPYIKKRFVSFCIGVPNIFLRKKRNSIVIGRHFWEIGLWGYSYRKIRKIILKHFKIIKEVKPILKHQHHFFVLEKK